MNGGGDINALGILPDKLKTELALHVNLETLKKVFQRFMQLFCDFCISYNCFWKHGGTLVVLDHLTMLKIILDY